LCPYVLDAASPSQYNCSLYFWLLVIGYWLLVIGDWLLVIGYWLLVIGKLSTSYQLPVTNIEV